jgi:uncharacterized protein (TIGR03435 family)
MSRFLTATLLSLIAVDSVLTTAQESNQAASFEVASIKPIQPGLPYPNFFIENNRFRGNHVTIAMVVAAAYGVHRSQLVGGPSWIDSDRFNIEALAESPLPPRSASGALADPVAVMVRNLLADRVQIRVRYETREMQVLALTRVPGDQKFNEHIRPAKDDCASPEAMTLLLEECFELPGATRMTVRGRPIERLVARLSGKLRRIVIDETGLSEKLDIDLQWEFARNPAQMDAAMLIALEEQLGLKLESRRVPMPAVIIEHIERPSPN